MESWRWFLKRELSYGAELVRKREEKGGDGRAHADTVNKGTSYTVQGRALPSQDSNAVGCFVLSWISQKIGITVSFLYQTTYGHYAIKLVKKYQSLSNSPEMLWWLVLVKPWLHLIGCRVPRWNIFNPDFWVCLWGCFQMRLAWGKQTALPNAEEHHPPWWGPE